jgi:DNA-binding NarL/FixJ family response regulator
VVEQGPLSGPQSLPPLGRTTTWPGLSTATSGSSAAGGAAWDEALRQTVGTHWLDLLEEQTAQPAVLPAGTTTADSQALEAGLRQLDRYLARAWGRAGIPVSQQDDCTQAVHTTMLETLGRPAFDQMLIDVGHQGIPQVLNRDSQLGPDFFRAVDMIKKRATRQRSYLALDDQPEPAAAPIGGDGAETWRGVLNDAINRSLSPREANLIRATLEGFSPAEIAHQWGLAPKTVSNEKTRALAKLREVLVAELND